MFEFWIYLCSNTAFETYSLFTRMIEAKGEVEKKNERSDSGIKAQTTRKQTSAIYIDWRHRCFVECFHSDTTKRENRMNANHKQFSFFLLTIYCITMYIVCIRNLLGLFTVKQQVFPGISIKNSLFLEYTQKESMDWCDNTVFLNNNEIFEHLK